MVLGVYNKGRKNSGITVIPATALIVLLAAGQSCQIITKGKTQTIPATSRPPGVNVLVDGQLVGQTPVSLNLARRNTHVVRFECEGYWTVEIHITQKRP